MGCSSSLTADDNVKRFENVENKEEEKSKIEKNSIPSDSPKTVNVKRTKDSLVSRQKGAHGKYNYDEDMEDLISSNKQFEMNCNDSSNEASKTKEFINFFEKAEVFLECDKYEKSLSFLLNAKKIIPNDYNVNFKIGDVYQRLEYRKGSSCIEYYKEAVKYCKNIDPHYKLAEALYLSDNKSELAEELFAESVSKYKKDITDNLSNSNLFKFIGISLFYLGNFNDSIENLKESIKLNPKDYESYFYLGEVFDKKENYEEAIKSYKESISLKPKYIFSMYKLSELYFKTKNNEFAIKYLDSAFEIDNKYEDVNSLKELIKDSSNKKQINIQVSSNEKQIKDNLSQNQNNIKVNLSEKEIRKKAQEDYIKKIKTLNNKNTSNTEIKSIDEVRIVRDEIKENNLQIYNNLLNLKEYNYMKFLINEDNKKLLTLIYLATFHGFKTEDFIKCADKKDNILLLVTINSGERFGIFTEQGFEMGQDIRKTDKKMIIFDLTPSNDRFNYESNSPYVGVSWIRHNTENELISLGFKIKENEFSNILFISDCDKLIVNKDDCINKIFYKSSYPILSKFTITQIELYQISD